MKWPIQFLLSIGLVVFFSLSTPTHALASTDYPVGNGDGSVGNNNGTWSTVHDASTGNDSNYTADNFVLQGDRLNGGLYYIYRDYLPIDTSGIVDSDTVTDAVLHIFSLGDQAWTGSHTVSVVATSQASATTLSSSDFNSISSTSLCTFTVGGQDAIGTEYTCSISDLSLINKTGYTYIGLRENDHDRANVSAVNDRYENFCSSSHATSAYRPFLRITASAGGGETTITGTSTSGEITATSTTMFLYVFTFFATLVTGLWILKLLVG